MKSEKPKSAIAAMLKTVQTASKTIEGSDIKVLKKDTDLQDLSPASYFDPMQPSSTVRVNKIRPNECVLWEYKDRPSSDLGDIEQLADDIRNNGQSQPGIVRELKIPLDGKRYEIIVGERRWRACSKINTSFEAVIKDISDHDAAIIQASENLQRKDLSDYAKGMNYAKLIDNGVISQVELQEKLNISKATMSALLSFSAIPPQVINLIKDISKLSANAASVIRAYANKGPECTLTLTKIAPYIRSSMGGGQLRKLFSDFSIKESLDSTKINETINKKSEGPDLFKIKINSPKSIEITFFEELKSIKKVEAILFKAVSNELKKENTVRRAEQTLSLETLQK